MHLEMRITCTVAKGEEAATAFGSPIRITEDKVPGWFKSSRDLSKICLLRHPSWDTNFMLSAFDIHNREIECVLIKALSSADAFLIAEELKQREGWHTTALRTVSGFVNAVAGD